MKFYWHESGKTAWSVFGTMLFCLIWYMRGLFIQIELNSLFQRGKRGYLLQKGYLSFTMPFGILKKIVGILLLGAVCGCASLCTKRSRKCWKKDPWRLIQTSVLDALKCRCLWPLKIFSDPFYHSFLLLIGHVKVWIPTTSNSSMPTSINTFWEKSVWKNH